MRIEHLALWTTDLDRSRDFYARFFGARPSALYRNPKTGFSSYFLSFSSGARIEIMSRADVTIRGPEERLGLAHFALSVGSKEKVVGTTEALASAGVPVVSQPRHTGDGYFESVIADPDGNHIEITI